MRTLLLCIVELFKSTKSNLMTNLKQRYTLLSLAALMVCVSTLTSCSSSPPPPAKDIFEGFSETGHDGKALINWHFLNADKVLIGGIEDEFQPLDSVIVRPKKSKKYFFSIISDDDTTSNVWRVYVPKKVKKLNFAFQQPKAGKYSPSYKESKYFKGILSDSKIFSPSRIKVMKTSIDDSNKETCRVRALILDEFGNYLPGYSRDSGNVKWSGQHYCTMGVISEKIDNFTENQYKPGYPNLDVAIALDNSASAEYNYPIIEYVREYQKSLSARDNFMFSYFDQKLHNVVPMKNAELAGDDLSGMELPAPHGLNAFNKAAYKTLVEMSSEANDNTKFMVLITFSSDNSSIIFESSDVANAAKSYSIPIYIIGVGNDIDSYSLKYLAAISGGKFYSISTDEISQVKDILHEITFAQKAYYEFDLPLSSINIDECDKLKSEITFDAGSARMSDAFRLILTPQPQYARYQALAAFDNKNTKVGEEFLETISSLALVLNDNPDFSIELIGHSSIEGSNDENLELSYARALSVKDILVSQGVAADRVRIRGEGSNKPIYYLQQAEWQQYYNRRVELRWLSPDLLPFEIIARRVWTEEEAMNYVERWEKRGYKSYYERYLQNNIPIYRVKIWGFPTLDKAETTALKLRKRFRSFFVVE